MKDWKLFPIHVYGDMLIRYRFVAILVAYCFQRCMGCGESIGGGTGAYVYNTVPPVRSASASTNAYHIACLGCRVTARIRDLARTVQNTEK